MDKELLGKIFVLCFGFQLSHALSKNDKLMQDNQKVFIWNQTTEDFRNLKGKSVTNFYSNILGKSPRYSLRNVTIRVIHDDMEPYIHSIQNSKLSGFLGDMWHILEEYLQFKSNITRIYNFDRGQSMISKNEADVFLAAVVHDSGLPGISFSQPYFWNWYQLYFKRPEGRPPHYVHFSVFSVETWFKIIVGYVLLTLVLWLTCHILNKVSKRGEICLSPVTYFMGIISAFLNTGYDLKLRSYSARLEIFVSLLFGSMCYCILNAGLVARLAVLDIPTPFESLSDLAAKKTHLLCVRNFSFVYANFTNENRTILPKWRGILNTEECPKMNHWSEVLKIICKDNMAVLENRILMAMVLNDPHVSCGVSNLPYRYFANGNYISLSQKFKGNKALKAQITKMKSAGIMTYLERKWIERPKREQSLAGANVITFNHVAGLLFIYQWMIGISLLLLILEILYKKYYEPKNLIHVHA